jgi:hypothetical protein
MASPAAVRALLVDSGQEQPRTSYRADMVTVLLGLWFVVGLFLDAWAHNNLPGLETFFTPWHGVFYSGFVATAGWICWLLWRELRAGRRGAAAVPVGYALGVLGLPLFALAGMGDYLWHSIFGIEQNLKILFSPTHLVLITSMILIVTSPLRAAWSTADGPATLRRLLPAVLALAFATTLVLLFLQYANALVWSPQWMIHTLSEPRDPAARADVLVASIAVTNVVLLAPMLLLARRWRVPVGAATILFTIVAGLCAAITAFAYPSIIVTLLAAGVGVDVLVGWLRPRPEARSATLAFAAAAPLLIWAVYFAVAAVQVGHLPNVVEYWTGIPVVAALLGLLVAVLMAPTGAASGRDHLDRVAHRDRAGVVGDQVQAEQQPGR